MYDLQVPSAAYEKQIQVHKSQAPMDDDKDSVSNMHKLTVTSNFVLLLHSLHLHACTHKTD